MRPLGSLPYTGGTLDRVAARRTDVCWVENQLASPGTVIIPLWRDQCLIREESQVQVASADAEALLTHAPDPVFLGLSGETAVFAADLSALDGDDAVSLAGADAVGDVRMLFSALSTEEAALLAYARGILRWNREQQFCGACGTQTQSGAGGHQRACPGCDKLHFPRIEPAVIVLVEAPPVPGQPDRCLLARHRKSAAGSFATLAGFVETGESLEEAVRREVDEEAGVKVGAVTYQGSQPWPFPSGIMIGFRAQALSEEITVDNDELVEARWFTRADLSEELADPHRKPDSIESYLIQSWLRED
ncbi:MAG TPA: NAD(+) diphosphatase [Streptosporangiaceae bacterium]|nr:NAD(+) diphosphatase [Streptosporangiaceae bacterium]